MRSINSTISSLLPVVALLIVGSFVMGAAALEEFALALTVGIVVGAFSSILIASPVVVWIKEREPRYREIRAQIAERGGSVVSTPLPTQRDEIGRAHVRTPVTNAHLVCRLLLEKKKQNKTKNIHHEQQTQTSTTLESQ